jgi:histidinol-phosphate aminotransferase
MSKITALVRPEILAMQPYQSARSSAGADGILLNANEAPNTLLEKPEWTSLALNRYPVPQPGVLKQHMAKLYGARTDQVLVTRGSDEGIDLLLRVFCRPGEDAIVECPPCFGMYNIAAQIQAAQIIQVPRDAQNELKIDLDKLCQTITQRKDARLVFITTPNNPTGDVISQVDLERILVACDEHALLVLDEAYIEFCALPSATTMLEQWPNLVVLRTLSKAWGAAALRCGSVIASPEIIGLLQRVMAPYPLSAPAIDAAIAITCADVRSAQQAMMAGIARRKGELLELLANCSWVEQVWPGEANFVLLRVDDAGMLVKFCAEQGIRIRDFSRQTMLEECVRITIGSSKEMAVLSNVLTMYGDRP